MTDERKPQPGDADYVGYGHPPEKNRFKKGQSGNPGGKSKAAKPEADGTEYERVMSQKVKVAQDGKVRKMTRRAFAYHNFGAALGRRDKDAEKLFFALEQKFGHLRIVEPKSDVQQGVLVVGPTLTEEQWELVYGGPKKLPPFPILDRLREDLFKKHNDDDEKA